MITLEDQIRRYATDVAGPAVAEAPTDLLDVGRPHHRGRWVLVAALVVFIAGLTWVATRPAELSDQPVVDTVPTFLPEPSSWAVDHGECVNQTRTEIWTGPTQLSGIRLGGPAGEGLCIGTDSTSDDPALWSDPTSENTTVWFAADGDALVPVVIGRCEGLSGASTSPVGGRLAYVRVVDDSVRTVEFAGPDGSVTAASFDVPGIEGFRMIAIWLPDDGGRLGYRAQYTESGEVFRLPPDQQETGLPPDCPVPSP